jgi:hypothetical protein
MSAPARASFSTSSTHGHMKKRLFNLKLAISATTLRPDYFERQSQGLLRIKLRNTGVGAFCLPSSNFRSTLSSNSRRAHPALPPLQPSNLQTFRPSDHLMLEVPEMLPSFFTRTLEVRLRWNDARGVQPAFNLPSLIAHSAHKQHVGRALWYYLSDARNGCSDTFVIANRYMGTVRLTPRSDASA